MDESYQPRLFAVEKICTKCRETKALSEFYYRKEARDKRTSSCKACQYSKSRRWIKNNPEKRREQKRRDYERRKDVVNQKSREWAEANPEKRRAIARKYNQKRGPEYIRVYKEQNRERVLESQRRRSKTKKYREQHAKQQRKRTALKVNAPGDGATLAELAEIHGPLCYICGIAQATDVEHIIPLSKGGTNYIENLKPACKLCNSRKSNKL